MSKILPVAALLLLLGVVLWFVRPRMAAEPVPAPVAAELPAEMFGRQGTPLPSLTQANVLLLVIDTTRAQQVGAWGYPLDTTPNVDALARAGVRFENFYSNSSWTRPGFAAIFTGRYARSVGIYESHFDRLPDDVDTLAEYLAARGYLTLGVTSNPNTNALFGFAQGFADYRDSVGRWQWMHNDGSHPVLGPKKEHHPHETADQVNERVFGLLDANAAGLAKQRWFLHLVYMEPHGPLVPRRQHIDFLARQAAGLSTRLDRAEIVEQYDAELRSADEQFGQLLAGLSARGLLDNTLVIVTSDHGEGLVSTPEYPHSGGHGFYLSEATTRVPLVVQHPSLPAGKVVSSLASTIDLLPTIADLLGDPLAEAAVDGRSLGAELRAGPGGGGSSRFVVSETEMKTANKTSVRTVQHTYIANEDARLFQQEGAHESLFGSPELPSWHRERLQGVPPEELYARTGSYGPSGNRLSLEPAAAARMRSLLQEFEAAHPRRPPLNRSRDDVLILGDGTVVPAVPDGVDMQLDEDLKAQLRALGYLGD